MKLYEFNHKSVVRTRYTSLLFYKLLGFFVVVSKLKNHISNGKGNRSGYALNTMNQNVSFVVLALLNELYDPIKKTLNILVLRIF